MKKARAQLWGWVGAAALLATAGCKTFRPAPAQPTDHLYILTSAASGAKTDNTTPAGSEKAGSFVVRLLPVDLAAYLNAKGIVIRQGNEIVAGLHHEWGEPLDEGLRQALARDLQNAPEIKEVLTSEPAHEETNVTTIYVKVVACEGERENGEAKAQFDARWQITGPDSKFARGEYHMPPGNWDGKDYGALAQQLSGGVEGLSRALLDGLAGARKP